MLLYKCQYQKHGKFNHNTYAWLPTAVSNLNPPAYKAKNPKLNDEEKKRLVNYFNTLIEMDKQTDGNATNETR